MLFSSFAPNFPQLFRPLISITYHFHMNRFPLFFLGFLFLIGFLNSGCKTASRATTIDSYQPSAARVAFYNVENLFDTLDNPLRADEEFTPTGAQQWNTERYQKKLQGIAEVIAGMNYPVLLGMAEVETATALKDLVAQPLLASRNYGFILEESPDYRGIDVGLLYNKQEFQVLYINTITINFPAEIIDIENYTTRDILHVAGVYRKDTLHVFVNHWPSRRGGEKESEPKRVFVAQRLRAAVDSIYTRNASANILIMGDFNDEPFNKSIRETLQALPNPTKGTAQLYHAFAQASENGQGSYNYQGKWNMLDQIIVSSALANTTSRIHIANPTIFRPDNLIFKHPKYGDMPNRTYGGPNYYGGVSDHFPIYVDLIVK